VFPVRFELRIYITEDYILRIEWKVAINIIVKIFRVPSYQVVLLNAPYYCDDFRSNQT
jgi:hypothetical protein